MKKAYSVQGDEHGCVVFAEHNVVARREGANELNIEFGDVESCRRAPQFDRYADAGKVPVQALLDAGWWMSCANCERMVYDDEPDYIVHADTVYCCEHCRDEDLAYRVLRGRREQAWADLVHERWPGSTVQHVYVFNNVGTVQFSFPGGKYPARFDGGKGELKVLQCDLSAWNNYRECAAEQGKERS